MFKFKKMVAMVMASAIVLSMAACGGTSAGSTPATPAAPATGDSSTPAPVAAGKKGSIEFWTVFTGADGKSMQAIVDSYNATNPDYTVNHRAIEANDLYLKMPLAIQSGQDVPDVAINHIERIPLFQENGFLTDLAPLLASSKIKADSYNPKAWTMTELAGGHYGIPLDVHSFVLYANMDLFAKYGKTELDDNVITWDEVYGLGEATKADGIMTLALTWQRACFLSSYAQLGGKLSTDGKTPDFNNAESKKVMDLWTDLISKGYSLKEGDAPWEIFLGGKALFCTEGIWMYNNVKEAGLNVKMVDFPVFEAGKKGNWTSSHQFVMPKDDKRSPEEVQAVLDFVDFVGNNSLEWAKAGQAPAHNSIKDNAEFKTMPQAFLTEENDELKIYDYKYYGYAAESLDKVLPEMEFGRMTPEVGMAQAVQETKDRIDTEG